jgi:hypothetical protein
MNRVIKFRAWSQKNKTFPFVGFHIIGETTLFDLLNQYRLEELDDLIIQQFTGLYDISGTPIYEGDIMNSKPSRFVVEFENGAYVAKAIFGVSLGKSLPLSQVCTYSFIIGNNLENPEQLHI